MKKVAVVTGTRAEYGILHPLIEKIHNSKTLELQLYATAMHLSDFYGFTVKEIPYPHFRITMSIHDRNNRHDMAVSIARGIENFADAFRTYEPDIVVVLGDRIEQLSATLSATTLGIPVAHIQGGDHSGGLDDIYRDLITRMASIHFPATLNSAKRITHGDIHVTGALGLDSILSIPLRTRKEIAWHYNIPNEQDWILILYHPDTNYPETAGQEMNIILSSLKHLKAQKIIIYPNSDAGSGAIIDEIEKCRRNNDFSIFKTMPHQDFISLLSHCRFMIGNSSCGIIEAPSLGIPAINIGLRQNNREQDSNIINIIKPNEGEIFSAIQSIDSKRNSCSRIYGNGTASKRMLEVLEND